MRKIYHGMFSRRGMVRETLGHPAGDVFEEKGKLLMFYYDLNIS